MYSSYNVLFMEPHGLWIDGLMTHSFLACCRSLATAELELDNITRAIPVTTLLLAAEAEQQDDPLLACLLFAWRMLRSPCMAFCPDTAPESEIAHWIAESKN
jgi:hypothetical protein